MTDGGQGMGSDPTWEVEGEDDEKVRRVEGEAAREDVAMARSTEDECLGSVVDMV